MINEACRLTRCDIPDLAEAVPEFCTRKHGKKSNKCCYQKEVVACKFTELVYVHGNFNHTSWRHGLRDALFSVDELRRIMPLDYPD